MKTTTKTTTWELDEKVHPAVYVRMSSDERFAYLVDAAERAGASLTLDGVAYVLTRDGETIRVAANALGLEELKELLNA